MPARSLLIAAFASYLGLAFTPVARAEPLAIGPHVGINLDHGNLHVGADLLIPITELSPSVRLGVWPSFAHVFIEDGHDVELLGCDFPFIFHIDDSIVEPFLAPGVGLAFYGDTSVKLNLIGGTFFETNSAVRPFVALAIRMIDGTFVDLLGGVLFVSVQRTASFRDVLDRARISATEKRRGKDKSSGVAEACRALG